MNFHKIEPAVDGGYGDLTEFVPGSDNRKLETFHMVLDDWLGDDLVTTTPGFAVTRRLADRLAGSGLSGFELKDMYLSISENGTRAMREKRAEIPDLVWMEVIGEFGHSDIFLAQDIPELIVSDRALALFQEFNLSGADIEDYQIQ